MDNATASPHLPPDETASALDERAWNRALVVAGSTMWAGAALIPFNDLLHGIVVGLCCLAAVVVTRMVAADVLPSLAGGPGSVLATAGALTLFVRFVVPLIDPDSLLVRIAAYVAFLGVYIGFFVLYARVYKPTAPTEERPQYSMWRIELFEIGHAIVISAALYLLARFFSWTLVLVLVAAGQISVITQALVRKYLRSEAAADRRVAWAGVEFTTTHPLVTLVTFIPIVAIYAYPIAAGVVYFTSAVPSDHLTIWIFRLTIIALFFAGFPLATVLFAGTMGSSNLGETLRVRQLLNQSGRLIEFGLFMSLLLWSFGVGDSMSDTGLNFSPEVVAALLAYSVLCILLPYVVGAFRARRQQRRFLTVHARTLEQLVAALERPHPAFLDDEFRRQKKALMEIEHASMRANPVLALAEEGDDLPADVRAALPRRFARGLHRSTRKEYAKTRADQPDLNRADDPRLCFWAQLRAMRGGIDEIALTLKHLSGEKATEFRQEWASFLGKRHTEIVRAITEVPRTRLPAWLTVGGLVAPIVSVVLSQFGNWTWNQITQSLSG